MGDHPSRENAKILLFEFTKSDSLRRHGLAVEQAMRKYAEKYNEDEEEWELHIEKIEF